MEFTCNICGAAVGQAKCERCGSAPRDRDIVRVLSMELFGTLLTLPEFPRIKGIRGLGASDSPIYAGPLAEKLDYRNTYYDREPRLDIAHPPADEFGKYDFVISSEVFEHVLPPVESAFESAFRLLKPAGVLVLTTPYSLEASTAEHFPELYEFGLAQAGERLVLVNRTRAGEMQVFENPIFHLGCSGEKELEAREFSESALRALIADAGFASIKIYSEDCPEFGIARRENWSLPMAARKGQFTLGPGAVREVMDHWRGLNREVARLGRSYWFRAGRKLGLI